MPIIGLFDPTNLFLSRRVASPPPPRNGPARVHVERFGPKAGSRRPVEREYPIDGPQTDPLTPIAEDPTAT